METTDVKLEGFTGRRRQTAAEDEDEDRRLVSAVLFSVVMMSDVSQVFVSKCFLLNL